MSVCIALIFGSIALLSFHVNIENYRCVIFVVFLCIYFIDLILHFGNNNDGCWKPDLLYAIRLRIYQFTRAIGIIHIYSHIFTRSVTKIIQQLRYRKFRHISSVRIYFASSCLTHSSMTWKMRSRISSIVNSDLGGGTCMNNDRFRSISSDFR